MNFGETDRGIWREPPPAPLAKTYCNPLPLPNYPQGRASRLKWEGGWRNGNTPVDFRETADPSVLYWEGRWYLYPSAGMAWVSDDFVTWTHCPMNISDVGYAPTIVAHRGQFYLTACDSNLYRANHPLGPWEDIGQIRFSDGVLLDDHADPMLFSDDDERLYLYWGLGPPAIFGIELDAGNPLQAISKPEMLFAYNPAHTWERFGEYNEDASTSWCEGAWMFKHAGHYYLTYSAPGTQFSSYGMGVYTADSPLGPYQYAARNPILRDTEGLVRGPGHGCLVKGPQDTIWAFYTCTRCYHHNFERRIGMDPAGFDADGNLFVRGASETPQWAPGVLARPQDGNATGLLPVTIRRSPTASSAAPGRDPLYAVDNTLTTWWQAAEDDAAPWHSVDLGSITPLHRLRRAHRLGRTGHELCEGAAGTDALPHRGSGRVRRSLVHAARSHAERRGFPHRLPHLRTSAGERSPSGRHRPAGWYRRGSVRLQCVWRERAGPTGPIWHHAVAGRELGGEERLTAGRSKYARNHRYNRRSGHPPVEADCGYLHRPHCAALSGTGC